MNYLIATGSSPMFYTAGKGNLRIYLNFLRGFINQTEPQTTRCGTDPVGGSPFLSALPNQQFSMKLGENDRLDLKNS